MFPEQDSGPLMVLAATSAPPLLLVMLAGPSVVFPASITPPEEQGEPPGDVDGLFVGDRAAMPVTPSAVVMCTMPDRIRYGR